jgi:hypothetical protein
MTALSQSVDLNIKHIFVLNRVSADEVFLCLYYNGEDYIPVSISTYKFDVIVRDYGKGTYLFSNNSVTYTPERQ